MHNIKKYFKGCLWLTIIAPLCMALEVTCDLLVPQFVERIVDIGIAGSDMEYVLTQGITMLVIALVGVAGGLLCSVFASYASQRFGYNLREGLFKKIQTFSFANLDTLKTSSLVVRMTNDVTTLQNMYAQLLRMAVRAPYSFVGGAIMAATLNARLAVILLVSIPLILFIVLFVTRKAMPRFRTVQKKLDKVNDVIRENLIGIRVVKAFAREDHEIQRFNESTDSLMKSNISASQMMVTMMPLVSLVMNITTVAVLYYGGVLANAGALEVGSIMAFTTYIAQILFSLVMVSMLFMQFSRVKVSLDRINEVFDTVSDIADPDSYPETGAPSVTEGAVEFRNVAFRYAGASGDPVLSRVNLSIKPGEMVAVMGVTGSGKSTLVNLIPRLYDATEGSVLIDGVDVRQYPVKALRDGIGMVLQQSVLSSGTVEENLRWGDPNATMEELRDAAKAADALEFIDNLPDGMNGELGRSGVNLSGGQKQRLCIARALVKKPKILIMDDSLSAVDTATDSRIRAAIRERFSDTTCIIVAQRVVSAMEADRIVILDGGTISAVGTHEELLQNCKLYADLYRYQTEVS